MNLQVKRIKKKKDLINKTKNKTNLKLNNKCVCVYYFQFIYIYNLRIKIKSFLSYQSNHLHQYYSFNNLRGLFFFFCLFYFNKYIHLHSNFINKRKTSFNII